MPRKSKAVQKKKPELPAIIKTVDELREELKKIQESREEGLLVISGTLAGATVRYNFDLSKSPIGEILKTLGLKQRSVFQAGAVKVCVDVI